MESIVLGIGSAAWRYIDGSDKRPKGSNLIGIGLVLLAGLAAGSNLYPYMNVGEFKVPTWHHLPLLVPCGVAGYLMVRGMPGWEEWKPMLRAFALPPIIAMAIYSFFVDSHLTHLLFGLSGLIVATTYVGLSKIEAKVSLPITAEKCGRLSYGFITAGLALL
jgi:hypothetical protein|tara:strand:+ start:163 stop:648 length:486 start_codon:yes stop_codon:yes gene_type:complete